jgi:5-bromo-4-chloroindolyl phosphate hydrolysis protein
MPRWFSGNPPIVAGGAFAILLPLLAFLGDLQFLWAFGLSAVGAAGVYLLATGRGPYLEINDQAIDASQREAARQILSEALGDVDRLAAAGTRIKAPEVKQQITHLSGLFHATIDEVTREPERLTSVRRLLTFYAPKAADIAEAYQAIERSPRPDAERLQRAGESLRKLDEAWAHFADRLAEPDRTDLDIELNLLDQSLKTDLEKLPWR